MVHRTLALLLCGLIGATTACSGAEPVADESDRSDDALSATGATCADADGAVFFHGLQGLGRELAGDGLCVPRLDVFSIDNPFVDAPSATVVGGYSAGRLPLLGRLASGRGREATAVMLDPSYSDGRRFNGRTGPSIVADWLAGDRARRFVFVYSRQSTGWVEYLSLKEGPVASQVRVCPMNGAHGDLPRLVTRRLFTDVDAWLAERCR